MKNRNKKRIFGVASIFFVSLVFGLFQPGEAQEYPTKPINYIVPFAPGGDTDLSARVWADFASKILGQPVVVVNKTGGGGITGTEFAAQSKPDGYTIFAGGPGPITISMQVNKVSYTLDSFVPVARIMVGQCGLVVRTNAPWKTEKELVQDAKKNPGKFIFGAPGVASWPTFAGKQWEKQAGIHLKIVQHQGSAPIVTAMLGGHVDITFAYAVAWAPQVRAGKLGLMAVDAHVPGGEYPGVPTFEELGYKGVFTGWAGIFMPKGVSDYAVKKLAEATKKMMDNPEFIQAMRNVNCTASYLGPEDLTNHVKKQYADLGKIVDELGLRAK